VTSEGPASSPSRSVFWIFALLVAAGAVLRLAALELRPLHGDEAVGALLSEQVKETGSFVYEFSNRHGPFQYLLGGAAMALGGESPFWIRLPFALLGCLLPLCLVPMRRQLGQTGWILATGLVTFSSFFVYYSRYAIQEIELAVALALLLGCGASFAAEGRGGSLAGALLAAAWLVTIKETFIIVGGCLAAALVLGAAAGGKRFRSALQAGAQGLARNPLAAALGSAGGLLLVAVCYTDFFRNGAGLGHLVENLRQMVVQGASSADAVALHRHPASFYLSLLVRYEWLVLALALAGAASALRSRRPLTLFLALFSLLTGGVYLALPYKTPWLLLTPLVPLAILAGLGGAALLDSTDRAGWRRLSLPAAAIVALLPLPRTLHLNFVSPADPVSEPLVYHQAGEDQVKLAREILRISSRLPADARPKATICLPYLWPLAWYLKDDPGVVYVKAPVPSSPPASLAEIPMLVTLERADPTFLKIFTGSTSVPGYLLPNHASRTVVLVPPEYVVARFWIRSDLAPASPGR
jgi:uncharacterized protein (TIGR03663 family)